MPQGRLEEDQTGGIYIPDYNFINDQSVALLQPKRSRIIEERHMADLHRNTYIENVGTYKNSRPTKGILAIVNCLLVLGCSWFGDSPHEGDMT